MKMVIACLLCLAGFSISLISGPRTMNLWIGISVTILAVGIISLVFLFNEWQRWDERKAGAILALVTTVCAKLASGLSLWTVLMIGLGAGILYVLLAGLREPRRTHGNFSTNL